MHHAGERQAASPLQKKKNQASAIRTTTLRNMEKLGIEVFLRFSMKLSFSAHTCKYKLVNFTKISLILINLLGSPSLEINFELTAGVSRMFIIYNALREIFQNLSEIFVFR